VRRGAANLLGGRALRHELFGLVSAEIAPDFDLGRMLNHGYLPRHYLGSAPEAMLRAHVDDSLKEEIAAEGLVRPLPTFSGFLQAAVLSDTKMSTSRASPATAVPPRRRSGSTSRSWSIPASGDGSRPSAAGPSAG